MSAKATMSAKNRFKFANAIENGNCQTVQRLIENRLVRVDARLRVNHRRTGLLYAVQFGKLQIVEILLRANASIALEDNVGYNAFELAWLYRHRDDDQIWFLLLSAGAVVKEYLYCEIAARSTAAIQVLIERGVVIRDLRDGRKRTPLHVAAMIDKIDVVRMLVHDCNVDLEARDVKGWTCIHYASRADNATLSCFINAGADVDSVCDRGATPLHRARDCTRAISLLAAGADVCVRDVDGKTALQCAIANATNLNIIYALLAGGSDLRASDLQVVHLQNIVIDNDRLKKARKRIAKARLDFVRQRALQVCIGLETLNLDALRTCEILVHACGPVARFVPFHQWWKIATTVKHHFSH